jgi:TonB family protein
MQSIVYILLLLFCAATGVLAQEGEQGKNSSRATEELNVQQEPQPLNLESVHRKIKYPKRCKDKNIQGKVIIRILVDKTGKPVKHEVLDSPHDLLTKACTDVIYDLQFSPAINKGEPVVCWVRMPFNFTLKKNEEIKIQDKK